MSRRFATLLAAALWGYPGASGAQPPAFVQFESGPVRPVALSPDGSTLLVTNVPDGYLEVVAVGDEGLRHRASVPVGIDPVAVAFRSNEEAWVVNHVSDSVSVVDLRSATVVQTLLVGDEPRDIVFAGERAFVTTAHRGQRRSDAALAGVPGAGDPGLTEPGVGRADVWVFDAAEPGSVPVSIATLFGDTPRGLAVSADGGTVYVAVFNSGNATTTIPEAAVCDGFEAAEACTVDGVQMPGGNPGPSANAEGASAPEVGLIVQRDNDGAWRDELGRDWSGAVRFDLPDFDVFALDARTLQAAAPPITGVGTTLFNIAVNPISGVVYVSNTESQNRVRFEGPGTTGGSTVQGDLARARISVVDFGEGRAQPIALNPHIDYTVRPAAPNVASQSMATPMDIAVSDDGETLYVAAYGSSRIGVRHTASLAAGANKDIMTSGGGPAGLALDPNQSRLYVYTRFDNGIAAHALPSGEEVDKLWLHTPEPAEVIDGRHLLYDARETSSNGEASCAACHIFGDVDHLAWDLGNPDARVTTGTIHIRMEPGTGTNINGTGNTHDFHPMKGPMTTQTLRGLQFSGAQHWRGDRSVGKLGDDPRDSETSFLNFIEAFVGLVGREEEISETQMESFADFAFSIAMPPNPVRNLDGTLTASQQAALDFYASPTRISDGVQVPNFGFNCEGCHALDAELGFFGTDGDQGFSDQTQIFKIPQLRNLYQKVGMFADQGDQIRGFGFLHDGSVDTLFSFLQSAVFDAAGETIGFQSDREREDMASLLLAFDSDVAPVVGQQLTVRGAASVQERARLELLLDAAGRPHASLLLSLDALECELVAKLAASDRTHGFVFQDGAFTPDDGSAALVPEALVELAGPDPLTLTAVLPGTGIRLGIDRDLDGTPDGLDACPMDPAAVVEDDCRDAGETKPLEPWHPAEPQPQDDVPTTAQGCGCERSGTPDREPAVALVLLLLVARRRPTE